MYVYMCMHPTIPPGQAGQPPRVHAPARSTDPKDILHEAPIVPFERGTHVVFPVVVRREPKARAEERSDDERLDKERHARVVENEACNPAYVDRAETSVKSSEAYPVAAS